MDSEDTDRQPRPSDDTSGPEKNKPTESQPSGHREDDESRPRERSGESRSDDASKRSGRRPQEGRREEDKQGRYDRGQRDPRRGTQSSRQDGRSQGSGYRRQSEAGRVERRSYGRDGENRRRDSRSGSGGRGQDDQRGTGSFREQRDWPRDPEIYEGISYQDLDREVRSRLRTLSKESAQRVGLHLVMAGELIDEYPELAYQHAQSAVRRAGRIDVVREAAALTAYATERYSEALREFRTVRRLSGLDIHRAAEADCERALGRPERALAVIAEAPNNLTKAAQAELAMVAAGARLDMEQAEIALILVEDAPRTPTSTARLDSMRVDILHLLGRHSEAEQLASTLPAPEVVLGFDDMAIEVEEEPESEPTSGNSLADADPASERDA